MEAESSVYDGSVAAYAYLYTDGSGSGQNVGSAAKSLREKRKLRGEFRGLVNMKEIIRSIISIEYIATRSDLWT